MLRIRCSVIGEVEKTEKTRTSEVRSYKGFEFQHDMDECQLSDFYVVDQEGKNRSKTAVNI